jgi:hypothetical protein
LKTVLIYHLWQQRTQFVKEQTRPPLLFAEIIAQDFV